MAWHKMERKARGAKSFWWIDQRGPVVRQRWGAVGAQGRQSERTLASTAAAQKLAIRLVGEKYDAGFRSPESHTSAGTMKRSRRDEFPRGVPLVEQCVDRLKQAQNRRRARPCSPRALVGLRLPNGKALPDTLRTFLAHDLTFRSLASLGSEKWARSTQWWGLDPFGALPARPRIVALSPEEAVGQALDALARARFKVPLARWTVVDEGARPVKRLSTLLDVRLKGSLVRLPACGEEDHFLYLGRSDARGEYPILGMAWEGDFDGVARTVSGQMSVFIKYPSFDVYLAHQIALYDGDDAPFLREYRAHRRRNPELPP